MRRLNQMSDRLFRGILTALGVAGVVLGLAIMVIGFAVLQPRVKDLGKQIDRNLELTGNLLEVAGQHFTVVESSSAMVLDTARMATELPTTLASVRATLDQSADTLEITGSIMKSLQEGISGIPLPGDQLVRSAASTQELAREIRELSGRMSGFRGETLSLARESTDLSDDLKQFRSDLPRMRELIQSAGKELKSTRATLDDLLMPLGSGVFVALNGGIYFLLGLMFLVLRGILVRLSATGEKASGSERSQAA